jgi:hypothetical protein
MQDLTMEEVFVPEWNGTVGVRIMSGAERDRFEGQMLDYQEQGIRTQNFRARLLVQCLCDEHGGRLFDLSEVEALGAKSSVALDRLFDVARRMNRMTTEEVEKLQGNFEATPDDASGSDLPLPSA